MRDWGNAPAFFYDRRELFCPRILSFRSGSRWVRLIFLGNPQGLPEKRRTRISRDLPQAKPKMETQGKHFDLFHIEPLRNLLSVKSCLLPYNNFRVLSCFPCSEFFSREFCEGGVHFCLFLGVTYWKSNNNDECTPPLKRRCFLGGVHAV